MLNHIALPLGEQIQRVGEIRHVRYDSTDSKFHILLETLDGEMKPHIERRKDFSQS